jgi:hypothetical protein
MTWATDYDYDHAHATRSRLFQFGNDNNDHPFDFVPEPSLQAQWPYPAVGGAYGHSAHCGSAHAPSTSSDSTSWGLVHKGHPTPPASSDPFAPSSSFDPFCSWDSSMPFLGFSGLETSRLSGSESRIQPSENGRSDERGTEAKQSTTAIGRDTEASWSEGAGFEPDIVHYQQESSHPGIVSLFFLNLSIYRWLTPCCLGKNRRKLVRHTAKSSRSWHSCHQTHHTYGTRGSHNWQPTWV